MTLTKTLQDNLQVQLSSTCFPVSEVHVELLPYRGDANLFFIAGWIYISGGIQCDGANRLFQFLLTWYEELNDQSVGCEWNIASRLPSGETRKLLRCSMMKQDLRRRLAELDKTSSCNRHFDWIDTYNILQES